MPEEPEHQGRAHQPAGKSRRKAGWRSWSRRLTGRLHAWWYPPPDHAERYPSYYGNARRSRPVRAWHRLTRRLGKSALSRGPAALRRRLRAWWYPPSDHAQRYPNYGEGRRSRPVRAWQSLKRQLRSSALGRGSAAFRERLQAWWHPPSQQQGADGYGYGYGQGQGRVSRPAQAWRRVQRRIKNTAFGRGYQALTGRWLAWWYPPSDREQRYPNYYSNVQQSRPAQTWRRWRRRIGNTAFGRALQAATARLYNWWYPPSERPDGYGYGSLGQGRVSRPVRLLRRWDRRLRQTWLGRKLSWLLDDVAAFLSSLRIQAVRNFARARIRIWNWLFRWQTAAWLAGLLIVMWFGYPRLRRYQERQYAQQAQLLLARGDFKRAALRAQQTLSLNKSNAVATRVFADLADNLGAPDALYWRQRTLLLQPDATNQIALASTALRVEAFPFPTAAKALKAVELPFQQTAAYQRVAGVLALKLGQFQEAEQHYVEALRLEPANPLNRMSVAVVRLQSRNPDIITDSRTTLELLRTDRQLGLMATRMLVVESIGRKNFERAASLSQQIVTNAQCSFSERVLHLAILKAGHSTNFPAFLAETQQRARDDVLHIGELATWMNRSGYGQQALDWLHSLPPEVARKGIIPIVLADSYAVLGKWPELERYLDQQRWIGLGLEHIRFAMQALAAAKQGNTRYASDLWQMVIRVSSGSSVKLSMLAKLSAAWGWKERTEEVLWLAAQKYPDEPWTLKSLTNLYEAQRDTAGLRRVAQTAFQRNPKDTQAGNNFAILSLLTGTDVARAHACAAELYAAEPKNPVVVSTYAFSLHKQGRTKEALAVLRDLGLAQLDAPAIAVYYGIMLAASGDAATAKHYLDKASMTFLLPEELAMVERAKTGG